MPQVHVGASRFSRIISSALGGWPTRCQGMCPPARPRRCRKVTSTLTGVLTMRSKMPARSAVDCITSYTHRIITGTMGNSRTCNNRLRKPSSGNQTQETKFRKPHLGNQHKIQESNLTKPHSGNQTHETKLTKPNPGNQIYKTQLRTPNSGNPSLRKAGLGN